MGNAFQLAGYFPRRTDVPPRWVCASHVVEICSVSTCIAPAPEGWIDRWRHNDLGFFNSVLDAQSTIPPDAAGFCIFAYRMLGSRFSDGVAEALDVVLPPVESLPSHFESLGFDIVTKDLSDFFECSPLSCNGMAAEAPVNSLCLLSEAGLATDLAAEYSRGGRVEPGYYYVVEVLRSRFSGPGTAA